MEQKNLLFSKEALNKLIGPLVMEQILAVAVGMIDVIMIASVGEAAVSGVSLVDNVSVLLIGLFGALATGGAVVTGHYLGQNDKKNACKAATGAELSKVIGCLLPATKITGKASHCTSLSFCAVKTSFNDSHNCW